MKDIKYFLVFLFLMLQYNFAQSQNKYPIEGDWGARLFLQANVNLYFNFSIQKIPEGYKAFIINGEEKLYFDRVDYSGDSLVLSMDLFDAALEIKIDNHSLGEKTFKGRWVRYGLKEPYEVEMEINNGVGMMYENMPLSEPKSLEGKWAVTFTNPDGRTSKAIGVFTQNSMVRKLSGTFLTTTGDYRYLVGECNYDQTSIRLSTFDMSHAYVFKAEKQSDGTLKGEFWSGKTGYRTWTAIRDDKAELPPLDQLTFLKEGYDQLAFSFPNLEKQLVSLQDEKYKGKPVIVQILGSWCPNCMDETAYLAPWYAKNKSRGVEIIGLAYEQSPDFEVAKRRVEAMKKRFNIEYEVLIAGTNNSEAASKTLPMLHKINAFPTTIYIDKKGKVRKIYTGFTGPGTGVYYERYKSEFEELMNTLIEEKD